MLTKMAQRKRDEAFIRWRELQLMYHAQDRLVARSYNKILGRRLGRVWGEWKLEWKRVLVRRVKVGSAPPYSQGSARAEQPPLASPHAAAAAAGRVHVTARSICVAWPCRSSAF